ncbi:hypothetical protein [Streptomyces sp. WZ.A104]|uniref:hypothetical protein n=1 Tax=Streptomyces sp. WZ.A104 TaxID=2023771 RepID=UPI00211BCE59|nr:hypothetical protein [Streptomyces sp. WZ.A104]
MSDATGKYSITLPRGIAEAARQRSGLSAYVVAAVARQIEWDNLNSSSPWSRPIMARSVRKRSRPGAISCNGPVSSRPTPRAPRDTVGADAGLHGYKCAIDAMLCATALVAPGPVTVLTSDPEDLTALCGGRVTVIKV